MYLSTLPYPKTRWGPAHFDPDGGKRFLYARVLFCCQLFREGVAHLAKVRSVTQ